MLFNSNVDIIIGVIKDLLLILFHVSTFYVEIVVYHHSFGFGLTLKSQILFCVGSKMILNLAYLIFTSLYLRIINLCITSSYDV